MRKRILALLLCVFILGSSFVQVSAANSTKDTAMNSTQLAAKRFSAKIKNQSEQETAREIMRQLGMAEKYIQALTEEQLYMIYTSNNIQSDTVYGKIDPKGNETLLKKETCIAEAEQLKEQDLLSTDPFIAPFSLEIKDPSQTEETDAYFHKSLFVLETKNAPYGTIELIGSFEWLSSPIYRCKDIMALSSTALNFDHTSASLTFVADSTYRCGTIKQENQIVEYYDYQKMISQGKFKHYDHVLQFEYNLPNDAYSYEPVNGIAESLKYTNMGFLFIASSELQFVSAVPGSKTSFTPRASYFHQWMLFEADVSLSFDGVSLGISPGGRYQGPYQIGVICNFTI